MKIFTNRLKNEKNNTNTLNVNVKRHNDRRTPTAAEKKKNASVQIITSMYTQTRRKIRLVENRVVRHCVADFLRF